MADDPLTMEHPRHVNHDTSAALDKAAQCARTAINLGTETYASKEEEAAAEQKAIINGIGAVLHLGAAIVYAIGDVAAAIGNHPS